MALCVFGQAAMNAMNILIFILFEDVDMDCSFSMRCYTFCLDSWFKSYEVLKILAKL
jgi:hypothetical protein